MINYTTAAEAAKLIKSNDSVYIQGSVSIPEVLVKAMADRGHELRGVKVYSAFAIGREEAPYCKPEYKDSFLVYSLFVSNSVRNWIAQGYGQEGARVQQHAAALRHRAAAPAQRRFTKLRLHVISERQALTFLLFASYPRVISR